MRTPPAHSLPPIVDVEASGLHVYSYPIEIAVLAHDNVSSWLIAREADWQYWDPVAEDMHGISRDMLREQGVSAHKVARELNATIQALGGAVYSDAAAWIAAGFKRFITQLGSSVNLKSWRYSKI